jgi:hypothetical protein
MTLTSTELAALTANEYAVLLNTETRRRAAEENWTGFGTLVECADFWARCEVHTGLDLAISNALGTYSDVYKETHGFRPRKNFTGWTLEEIEAELTSLFEYTRLERDAEEAREMRAEKLVGVAEAHLMEVTLEGVHETCEAMAEALGY